MRINAVIEIDGELFNVASIWLNEDGTVFHVAYHKGDTVETVFGFDTDLSEILLIESGGALL